MLQFVLKKPFKCVLKIAAHKPLESFQKYFWVDVHHLWLVGGLKCGTKSVLLTPAFTIERVCSTCAINSLRQKICIEQVFLKFW